MKITVKNFGPIREAKNIRLSPMTLFVGHSNTGKTYLAVLLYSVADILGKDNISFAREVLNVAEKFDKISEKGARATSAEVRKFTNFVFGLWAKTLARSWREKMLYCFGEEGENIINDKSMSVEVRSDDRNIFINLTSPGKSTISARARKELDEDVVRALDAVLSEKDSVYRMRLTIMTTLFFKLYSMAGGRVTSHSHYLPAIRGGIMQSHRALVDSAMEQAPMVGLTNTSFRRPSTPMFTGVLSDFMRSLINLDKTREMRGHAPNKVFGEINKRMESAIMSGEIEIQKNETGYPYFRYLFSKGTKKHALSLKNTSSMVSELAPVSIFIRHHLAEGDLFILEEPEAHLHPKAQRLISDVLVRLANAGVFVLATTHSDIVLQQISNAVHASEVPKYAGGIQPIAKDKAVAYSFIPGRKGTVKGTVVKEHAFRELAGLVPDDHLEVSEELYNESVDFLNGKKQ